MNDQSGSIKAKKTPWKTFSGKVLVAEDNPANRMLIETLLKKHGLDITLTVDGQQALDAGLSKSFDLILMDMQMPVLNGYEATRQLRDKGIATPIIALTASVMASDRKKCAESGCNDFLGKPINRLQLQEILQAFLPEADAVEEKVDQLSQQTQQLNQLVDQVTPTEPTSILNEDQQDS
jgi:two-component system, sensor histidine kinase LadS